MRYLSTILVLIFFTGCSIKYENNSNVTQSKKQNIQNLSKAISNLSSTVNKKEALTIANIAYEYSLELANQYELVSPALLHNTLINMNIKKRGFCYHFAQDLLKELNKQNIQTLNLQWITHKKADYWEHNALLVTAKNQFFKKGIVLDAWRDSGTLYWNYLKNDSSYHWILDHQKTKYYSK